MGVKQIFVQVNKNMLVILALALIILYPFIVTSPFYLSLIIKAGLWAITAMGLAALMRAGQLSLGQAAFMALGAYCSAIFVIKTGISFWLGLLMAGVFSGLIALLVGMLVLRLGGIYFSIITLALGEVVRIVATNLTGLTNGTLGLAPPPPGDISIFGASISFVASKVPFYYLVLILVIIAAIVYRRLDQSRIGRIVSSTSMNEVLSSHIGIHLMKYRVILFTVAGIFAGITGAIFAHFLFFIGPNVFGVWQSIMVVMMVAVGGPGSAVAGPVIGALVISAVGDYLTTVLQGLRPLVFGIMVVVILYFLPGGLVEIKKHFLKVYTNLKGVFKPCKNVGKDCVNKFTGNANR